MGMLDLCYMGVDAEEPSLALSQQLGEHWRHVKTSLLLLGQGKGLCLPRELQPHFGTGGLSLHTARPLLPYYPEGNLEQEVVGLEAISVDRAVRAGLFLGSIWNFLDQRFST